MLSWSWHKPGYLQSVQNDACKKPFVVTVVKKETSRGMVKKFRPMSGGGGQWGWRGGGVTPTPGRQVWSPSKLYHKLNRTSKVTCTGTL